MFIKQRIICLLLSALLIVSLAACNGNDSGSNSTTPPASSTGDNQQSGIESGNENDNTSQGGNNAEEAKLTGKLNLIDLDDRDPSVLRGVAIKGVNVGSYDGINGKESSLTDVRCIFELGEWVEFYPDTDATYGLRVWILKHRDDQEYYNTAEFSDLDPNFASYCDLRYPEDEENPDEWYWGSFYLNEEECEPGYYDFVFTYEGKAIATLLTRFYKWGELSSLSDDELEDLIESERADSGESANVNGNGNDNDISGGGEIPENVFYAFQDAVGSDGDTWPTEEMWASIGLPALDYAESGENVLLMITNDSLSVTGYADNETLADTLNGLAAMLADAGLAVDSVNTLTGGEQQVADYEYNGIPLQIRIGSNATAQINIFVSVIQ
ncbi:MAG: hypothetical protein IJ453_05505 [Oscillospiraceae bacterium]|nr:hypothetical protein [Oscillospiraceae bacterium]